ncbi:MAG: SMI1/KNR4 family protein [Planctomycetaceae bacterium]|jgi:hypothetical protein|nr:SMI1/KNR4 family protein [Planctomycetaceae bacterium]
MTNRDKFFQEFWDENDYSQQYTGQTITLKLIDEAEKTLGYKLPWFYIELLKSKNGGVPKNDRFPTQKPTCWAKDHIAISGILGINDRELSLLGGLGSRFMIEEWGYPDIGIIVCDCPSAGHDAVMLDYRQCGENGEPKVIHVDVETSELQITHLADNFESFIRGLVNENVYTLPVDEKKVREINKVQNGSFSPVLLRAFQKVYQQLPDAEQKIRRLATKIVEQKGFFAIHDDEFSLLMMDYLFWLFCQIETVSSLENYKEASPDSSYNKPYFAFMVSLYDDSDHEHYGFCTNGYCASFVHNWWINRFTKNELEETLTGYTFTDQAVARMLNELELI